MCRIGIFMADGLEEVEALTVVDDVRRAGMEIDMISLNSEKQVTGSHGITVLTETTTAEADYDSYDGIVLPGGVPGVHNLFADETVDGVLRSFAASGKLVAAICAGPYVLGQKGLLEGKHATCHPGWEEKLTGAILETDTVVRDGNIITSRGMGTAIDFSFGIIRYFKDEETVQKIAQGLVYRM